MVLKRKLPSTMGENVASSAKHSEATAPESASSNPQVETGSEKKPDDLSVPSAGDLPKPPPIAPEPELDAEPLSSKDPEDDMTIPVKDSSPVAPIAPPSFGEEGLDMPKPNASAQEETASSGWRIEDLVAPHAANAEPAQTAEIPVAPTHEAAPTLPEQPSEKMPESSSLPEMPESNVNLPPWQQGGGHSEPPILPGAGDEMDGGSKNKAIAGLLLLAVLAGGAYYTFVERGDTTTERLARITNALEEVSEQPLEDALVKPESVQPSQPSAFSPKAPEVVVEADVEDAENVQPFLDFPAEGEELPETNTPSPEVAQDDVEAVFQEAQEQSSEKVENQTVVEFIDVPEGEVDELITGEDVEEVPEDVTNFVDRWKNAVEKAEQKRQGAIEEVVEEETNEVVEEIVDPYERERRNSEKLQELEEELTAYRRILAGENADGPKKIAPLDFFNRGEAGAIPEPERAGGTGEVKTQQQAASMYGANPYNLPVVSEPDQKPLQKIRTLDDFDVTMFEPEKPRVRIPKNVHPSFKAHEFPEVYLLSLVPGQGIVAQNRGRQGVLMLGESLEGWELVAVASQYAEFRKGKRRHVLTLHGVR